VKGYRVSYRGEAGEKVRRQICWASCLLYKDSITYRALYIIINVKLLCNHDDDDDNMEESSLLLIFTSTSY
jgi:hypothetical protein